MKRHSWILFAVFVVSLLISPKNLFAKAYSNPNIGQESTMGNRVDQETQETERTKELLEIWKDHVRTLTRERDEAYKEIEALKNRGGLSSAANTSAEMSDPERNAIGRVITELKSKVQTLQSQNEELKMARPKDAVTVDQDLKLELAALRSENRKLRLISKENTETQSDKEIILKEKEEALRQLGYLKDKMSLLQKQYEQLQSDNQKPQVIAKPIEDHSAAERLKITETELQEARDTFASYMKEMDAKNELLNTENKQLRAYQFQQLRTIKTLKANIQSSLDSLESNCGDQKK